MKKVSYAIMLICLCAFLVVLYLWNGSKGKRAMRNNEAMSNAAHNREQRHETAGIGEQKIYEPEGVPKDKAEVEANDALAKVAKEIEKLEQKMGALTAEYHRDILEKYTGWTKEQARQRQLSLFANEKSLSEDEQKEYYEIGDFLLLTVEVPSDPDVIFLGNDIIPTPYRTSEEYMEASKRYDELRYMHDTMRKAMFNNTNNAEYLRFVLPKE